MCDVKTWTRFLAMAARRTRRTSSSLLPENITPAMTSIQPGRVPWNMGVKGEFGGGDRARKCRNLAVFRGVPPYCGGFFWGFFCFPPQKEGVSRVFFSPSPPKETREQKPPQ